MTTIRGYINDEVPTVATEILNQYCDDVTWGGPETADFTVSYDRSLWLEHGDWGHGADDALSLREQAIYLCGVINAEVTAWQYEAE